VNLNPVPTVLAQGLMTTSLRNAAEERAALGARLVSSLAHAIGTPLNIILGRATMLEMKADSREDVIRNARIIEQQARAIDRTLRSAVTYLRSGRSGEPGEWPLAEVLQAVVTRWEDGAEQKGARLVAAPTKLTGSGRLAAFSAALDALVQVALDRCSSGDELRMEAGVLYVQPPDWDAGRLERGEHVCVTLRTEAAIELPARPDEPWLGPEGEQSQIRVALALAAAYEAAREHGGWVETADRGDSGLRLVWSVASPGG
jgi:two-component system NtrC family sensor kinase